MRDSRINTALDVDGVFGCTTKQAHGDMHSITPRGVAGDKNISVAEDWFSTAVKQLFPSSNKAIPRLVYLAWLREKQRDTVVTKKADLTRLREADFRPTQVLTRF
jgi:hypothetical protein